MGDFIWHVFSKFPHRVNVGEPLKAERVNRQMVLEGLSWVTSALEVVRQDL